jgi:metal transporter CNNM
MIYVISVLLILCSALFSGLTLGLMSLNVHALKRKAKLGNKLAKRVYPVRKRGNLLLTTLLLGNVAVNAALSIFLGTIASGLVAGLIATGLIFLFGEIIPQAVISRHALWFGAKTAWFVKILLFISYPVTAPIAWILDRALGQELPTMFSKSELMSVIEEHEDSQHSDIDEDEERILKGALTFSDKLVDEVMTPIGVVGAMIENEKLTDRVLGRIRKSGFSRLPVFDVERKEVVGIVYLRDLVGRQLANKTVKQIAQKEVVFVHEHEYLDVVFNRFLKMRKHLFVVLNEFDDVTGIITVEDILEEIVGSEIVDETDRHVDMRARAKKRAKKK